MAKTRRNQLTGRFIGLASESRICPHCGTSFEFRSEVRKPKFCCREHYLLSLKGRGMPESVRLASNKAKKSRTHCKRGHPFSGANLEFSADGSRVCRQCHLDNARTSYERNKDRARENYRRYYASNRVAINRRARERWHDTTNIQRYERLRENSKRHKRIYRAIPENRAKSMRASRKYYATNREAMLSKNREWYDNHRGRCAVCGDAVYYKHVICHDCHLLHIAIFGSRRKLDLANLKQVATSEIQEKYKWLRKNRQNLTQLKQQFQKAGSVPLKSLEILFENLELTLRHPKPRQSARSTEPPRTSQK